MRRKVLRFINKTTGTFFCVILFLFDKLVNVIPHKRKSESRTPIPSCNILVIKIVGLGDTVLMLPSITALKATYPQARISAMVTPLSSGILQYIKSIDELIVYDIFSSHKGIIGLIKLILLLRRKRFNLVIDFEQHIKLISIVSYLTGASRRIGFSNEKLGRGLLLTDKIHLDDAEHTVKNFAELVKKAGVKANITHLERIDVPDRDRDFVENWLSKRNIVPGTLLVGIHPGSGGSATSRRWPKERFAQIADKLAEIYGARVIITGSPSEVELANEVARLMKTVPVIAAGQMSIGQLIGLIDKLHLYISNDTGPMHISAAMGTPTIGLFGPNTPVRYKPYGNQHISIYKPSPCSPCINVHKGEVPDCKQSSVLCLESITVEEVWYAIEKLIRQ